MFKLYFYGVFLTSLCTSVFADQCYGVLGPLNNNYFTVSNNPTPWNTAESFCYNKLGHLASSTNVIYNNFLQTNIAQSIEAVEFWLGGMINYNHVWSWTNANLTYTRWANGEPSNNQSGNCIAMNKATGQWRAANCAEQKPYICEIPKNRQWDSGKCDSSDISVTWQYAPTVNKCYFEKGGLPDTYYTDLVTYCNGLKPNLNSKPLIIHSVYEMSAVQGLMDAHVGNGCDARYILGLHDQYNNGSYIWADGTKVNYTGWSNYTSPPPSFCFFAHSQGENLWVPSECNVTGVPINIICQYDPQ